MPGVCCTVVSCPDPDCVQLTQREAAVCKAICESGGSVGFLSIKREVGLHQEILSRIMKRLVNYGAVRKTDGKYSCAGQ